jgi:hypothetical protein
MIQKICVPFISPVILVSRLLKDTQSSKGKGSYGKGPETNIRGDSMSRLQHKDLIKADETMTVIVDLTLNAMAEAEAAGMTDDQLIIQLWRNFLESADKTTKGAATLHMAMSCYRLALAMEKIHALEEQLDFHRDAIEMLTELDGL